MGILLEFYIPSNFCLSNGLTIACRGAGNPFEFGHRPVTYDWPYFTHKDYVSFTLHGLLYRLQRWLLNLYATPAGCLQYCFGQWLHCMNEIGHPDK